MRYTVVVTLKSLRVSLLLLHLQFVLELLDKKGKLAILYIDARLLQESILVELVVLLFSLLQPRLKI